jgi:hypothetical protein
MVYQSREDKNNVKAAAGIFRLNGKFHHYHRRFLPFPIPRNRACASRICRGTKTSTIQIENTPRLLVSTPSRKETTSMSAKIKLAALTALLTAFSVYGTALAQSNGNLSGHRASKPVQRLTAKIASATVYVPVNAYGSAAPYSSPATQHRSANNNIVNKSGQLEREEVRRLDDPNWILCHDLSIC